MLSGVVPAFNASLLSCFFGFALVHQYNVSHQQGHGSKSILPKPDRIETCRGMNAQDRNSNIQPSARKFGAGILGL